LIGNSLRELKNQLPKPDEQREQLEQWWYVNSQVWVSQLRTLAIEQRNIGHEWHLSEAVQQRLEQYSVANQLLVECLSNCQLTPAVRQAIEESLLLPE
jgi:predicted NACHT family NTPase